MNVACTIPVFRITVLFATVGKGHIVVAIGDMIAVKNHRFDIVNIISWIGIANGINGVTCDLLDFRPCKFKRIPTKFLTWSGGAGFVNLSVSNRLAKVIMGVFC